MTLTTWFIFRDLQVLYHLYKDEPQTKLSDAINREDDLIRKESLKITRDIISLGVLYERSKLS